MDAAGANGVATALPPGKRQEVPVVVATRDFQGAVGESVAVIWNAFWTLGRDPVYVQFASHGYAFVRAGVFRSLRANFGVDRIRGLMIDDDILIKDQVSLMKAIKIADEYGWNFVAPYRVRDGYVSLAHKNGALYTLKEARMVREWDHVSNAGLGFYYGDLPLTYRFHEDGIFGGEDLNFFYDNPDLEPRVVNLGLKHLKTMELDFETNIPFRPRPQPVRGDEGDTADGDIRQLNGPALAAPRHDGVTEDTSQVRINDY